MRNDKMKMANREQLVQAEREFLEHMLDCITETSMAEIIEVEEKQKTVMKMLVVYEKDTPIETSQQGDNIIVKLKREKCIFCNNTKNLTDYMGKKICRDCISDFRK